MLGFRPAPSHLGMLIDVCLLLGIFFGEIRMACRILSIVLALLASHSANAQYLAPTRIAIAHPGPISVSVSIPLAIAQEQGLFAKYGFPRAGRIDRDDDWVPPSFSTD
jgi:ABC-type nitrate/sulfonate/bicarbonate transport system substrate-binding protein